MSCFRSRGRAEHFRRMGVTVSWWRPEWESGGVEASGEPAANNDGETSQGAPASRGGGRGTRGRGGYPMRSSVAGGRTNNNDEWSTGARQTDNAPPMAFDRPRGGGGERGRGRGGASQAPPIASSTPMPTQNPGDAWGNALTDPWATAPDDQTSVQASRGGASRGRGRGGSTTARPPTAEADDEWACSTTATTTAARSEQPQPAIRGSRPRPARGAAAFDAPSTRAPEPTQRTADDEPTYSTAARGSDGGRGRGRGRGASGMAPATTRTEEFSHPQRDEGDEWSTSAPPPAGQQTEQEGLPERTGLGKPNLPVAVADVVAAVPTSQLLVRLPPRAPTGALPPVSRGAPLVAMPPSLPIRPSQPEPREVEDVDEAVAPGSRTSSRVEGFQPTAPRPQPEEDEWSGCVGDRYAKPAGGQPAVSSGARGGRGRGRGGSASAAPAPESDFWGTAGGEASATTQNTGQVTRGGARGRGSGKWASGPSAAATTTAHTEGFQTTVAPPPQQEEEDEWAVCVPAVGQQTVPGTQQRPEQGAPVFTGSGRGRGRGSSYGERSERGPTSVTQERPSSGFGGGGRQVAATPAVIPAGSDDGWPAADKTQEASAPSARGESGRGELVRQFSNDGFPSAITDAGPRGGYRGRGGGGRGRSAVSDARQP